MKAPEGFLPVWTEAFRAAGRPPPVLRSLEPVAGGSINRAYRAVLANAAGPRTLFCKWNASAPADFFAREAEGLEALRAVGSPLVIPRVLAVWPPPGRPGPGLLALEWLEPAAPGTGDWEAFGRALAALHAAPWPAFGWERDNYCGLTPQPGGWSRDWAAFYAERRIAPLVDRLAAQGALAAADRAVFARLIARLPALLAHAPAPSLIHGDLWPGNFLASSRGPALVDPAAHCADAEAEWGMMSLFGGFPDRVRAAYEEARPLPAGWRERQPLYRLYHVLNHAALFGGGYLAQALAIARRF
jgi:fructosamine-3-kinase